MFVTCLVLFSFDCYVVSLLFVASIVISVDIMVLLANATSVEIPMSFLGTNSVR